MRGDDAIPPAIGKPALRALARAGCTDLKQLSEAPAEEIAALHGVGPKAMRILREALSGIGRSFRGE